MVESGQATGGRGWHRLGVFLVLGLALWLRTAGLFRGLSAEYRYHPDEPKQVVALAHYLRGEYVWYTGDLFYDGYPYGLNHVDEWLLRPVFSLRYAIGRYLDPEAGRAAIPDLDELTAWARGLRVFYGLLCIGLTYGIARRLALPSSAALAAAFLVGIAPVSVAVSRTAAGDIGVDLFGSLMLLFLCGYADSQRRRWLAPAAVAAGMAYACKYNGLLALVAVAGTILLGWLRAKDLRRALGHLALTVCGFVAGVVILTPGFLINGHRTWKDMRANLDFIRNYDVSEEFLARPLWERVGLSLGNNTPKIMGFLGWAVVVLAFAAAFVMLARALRKRKNSASSADRTGPEDVLTVCCVYPFIALLVSLVSKPEVQPFHFSYLQVPLALAAVTGAQFLRVRSRLAGAGVLLVAAIELGAVAWQGHFFWAREDNVYLYKTLEAQVFNRRPLSGEDAGVLKDVFLEPENAAVFRNRYAALRTPLALPWESIGIAPLPSIPYPVAHHWIFLNGPVFPRNDRLFGVMAGVRVEKELVAHGAVPTLALGVRSGTRPVEVRLECGGRSARRFLPPNSQEVVPVTEPASRRIRSRGDAPADVFIVPLAVEVSTGDAWIEVLADARQAAVFELFGGRPVDVAAAGPVPGVLPGDIADAVETVRYLENGEPSDRLMDSDDPDRDVDRLPAAGMALPAGAYVLDCAIVTRTASTTVALALTAQQGILEQPLATTNLSGAAHHRVRLSFAKPFAPYACTVSVRCLKGECRVVAWEIRPDAERTLRDLQTWKAEGVPPPWYARFAAPANGGTNHDGRIVEFAGGVQLLPVGLPPEIRVGGEAEIRCGARLAARPFAKVDAYQVFFHLMDGRRQCGILQVPLAVALETAESGTPVRVPVPADTCAGSYEVQAGLFNARTGQRLSPREPGATPDEIRTRRIVVGRIVVRE